MRPFEACPFCNGEFMFDWINDTRRCNNCGALFTWRIIREPSGVPIDLTLQLKKAEDRIAELEEAQRWIPVSERLPEDRVTILAAFNNREILTAKYYKYYEGFGSVENYWRIEGWHSGNVTHWMPLPTPPEVQESEATSCEFCGSNKSDILMNSIVCTSCGRKIGNIAPPEVQE